MASLSDTIFGSDPKTTTSQNPLMTPQQSAGLAQVIQDLMAGGATTAGKAYTPYSGTFTAPTSNLQNLSLSALEQQTINEATGGPGSNKAAQQAIDQIIKTGGSPVDINKTFTDSVETPMLYDFQNKILPMLQSTFSGSAAFGSDKLKQQELLTNNLTKNLTSSRSSMAYQSQNDAMNRLLQAAGLAPQIGAASSAKLTQGLAAGAVPQQTQQAQLTAQYQDFLRGQTAQQSQVQQLMSALGMSTFQPTTTVTPGSQGIAGGMANTLTAMLSKAALSPGGIDPTSALGGFFGLGGGSGLGVGTTALGGGGGVMAGLDLGGGIMDAIGMLAL